MVELASPTSALGPEGAQTVVIEHPDRAADEGFIYRAGILGLMQVGTLVIMTKLSSG